MCCPSLADGGTWASVCQVGRAKVSLTPPPVAELVGLSFHTTSLVTVVPDPSSRVPPHPSTYWLEAGKSTCALPSPTASPEPLSPAAQQTVTPNAAAA